MSGLERSDLVDALEDAIAAGVVAETSLGRPSLRSSTGPHRVTAELDLVTGNTVGSYTDTISQAE